MKWSGNGTLEQASLIYVAACIMKYITCKFACLKVEYFPETGSKISKAYNLRRTKSIIDS